MTSVTLLYYWFLYYLKQIESLLPWICSVQPAFHYGTIASASISKAVVRTSRAQAYACGHKPDVPHGFLPCINNDFKLCLQQCDLTSHTPKHKHSNNISLFLFLCRIQNQNNQSRSESGSKTLLFFIIGKNRVLAPPFHVWTVQPAWPSMKMAITSAFALLDFMESTAKY